ncbi:hypothetical protein [Caballeronia sp. ATUFL_M2_KS44]|uniref:hypothetical protein n=1 Tax=Caballeronia sp. ATUFL_M2_KS44 TaxID=2921767 RepID=UPI002028A437|nr:hypothetical protein [Caballeronia sp. ATUFL_M2_KS44]
MGWRSAGAEGDSRLIQAECQRVITEYNIKNEVRAKKLLSLVTFFAAAKKVTPAPGRGELIDRREKTKKRRNEETKKRRNEETKKRKNEETKKRRNKAAAQGKKTLSHI